ncbi:Nucleolar Complex 2 protein [Saitozyma podzolica]|uniref:Nucleolar Complex 2 protein n=1 Tax=Saitozyma podzolica TaxID=1890683 RepID=A0A427YTG0_9TREE|nr:Nucleolar Complex 2 protein [Saitozyma podzolica]
MGNKTKAFKKFASSGKLKDTIKSRRKHQQSRKRFEDKVSQRAKQRGAPKADDAGPDGEDEAAEDEEDERESRRVGAGSALWGNLEGDAEGSDLEELDEEDEEDEDEDEEEGDEDEGDLAADEKAMEKAMKDLAKKDPEFFKYLQENDRDLLEFGGESKGKGKVEDDEDIDMEDEEEDEEDEMEDEDEDEAEAEAAPQRTSVTGKMLRQWQEGMLRQHSVRSLRKTLLAFRTAAHMNEEDTNEGSGSYTKYTIDSPQIFNKLVVTALKFTPVVVAHHLPYKTLPTGRLKLLQPKKPNPSLNRLVLSHFSTLLHFMKSLPSTPSSVGASEDAGGLLLTAVNESTKMLPWVMGARKHLRAYLKVLLELWSSASDSVRIASFLAIRKMFVAGEEGVKELCLRNTYRSLLRPLRNTTAHTLPSINLMKNTAAELYQLAPAQAYQQAFTFIRMLAVHLRGVVRGSTSGKAGENQEAFKAVYNWQYVHCIDFWSQVLAGACSAEAQQAAAGAESPLKPLIYPLVQIALGVVRLLPSSRYFPLRFHILHAVIRLVSRTGTYIPLSPFLLEILDSNEFARSNPRKSTLKPLDFEYVIRAPQAYSKTRVFQEGLGEELVFLLGEYHACISTNIAFPEITLPVILTIRRHLKKGTAGSPKVQNSLKTLVEKLEATRTWVETKRRNVSFAPRDRSEVSRFCEGVKVESTPVGTWMKLQRKVREQRRREVERALREEREQPEDDEDDE